LKSISAKSAKFAKSASQNGRWRDRFAGVGRCRGECVGLSAGSASFFDNLTGRGLKGKGGTGLCLFNLI
jgi:hypothetical protein